jgi:type III restriction enzyme
MNTVGKEGRLGESIRCVVSVSMLTEGWDANTVTHVLGVRAFGTQLLCEQVIGRALRRQSYDLNEENLFNVEYADVLGIPFDFTAKPVIAPPQPPRETIQVKAVRPERDALEIRFPRVSGYRVELPEERLTADFNADSVLELTPDLVGPSITKNEGIIGEGVELTLEHLGDMRLSTLLFHLVKRLIYTKWRDTGEDPKLHLFGQLKRITKQWLDTCLVCKGGTYPAQLMYQELADMACERITAAITRKLVGTSPIKAVLDPYNPTGSTRHVKFNTSRTSRWQTDARRCHINWIILDSDWESEFCRVAESHPRVKAYVKNHNLGLEVPYRYGSEARKYLPDFIVLVDDGRGDDLLHLIVEIKGYRREDAKEKKSTMDTYWVPGVNNDGRYGRWAFAEFTEAYQIEADFAAKVEAQFDDMIESVTAMPTNSDSTDLERANAYIATQLGADAKWARLNNAVLAAIRSTPEHAFQLSDLDAVSESASCSADETLSLLALLSGRSAGILKMELRSESPSGSEIPPSEFIRMLTNWWRAKSISEATWREWASRIYVRWVPASVGAIHE